MCGASPLETCKGVAALPYSSSSSGASRPYGSPAGSGSAEPAAIQGAHAARPYACMDTKLGIINSQADLPATLRVIKVNGTCISSASICTGGSALTRNSRGEDKLNAQGHAPCSVLFCKLVLYTHLRKTVFWTVTKNILCFNRNK